MQKLVSQHRTDLHVTYVFFLNDKRLIQWDEKHVQMMAENVWLNDMNCVKIYIYKVPSYQN